MTREDLQGRAIRLRQLTYGLAADLDGYPRGVALQAAALLSLLDDLLTPVCGHCGDYPPHGHTCPACGKQARPLTRTVSPPPSASCSTPATSHRSLPAC